MEHITKARLPLRPRATLHPIVAIQGAWVEAAAGEGVYEGLGGAERREAVAVAGALPLHGERVAEEEDVQAKVPVANSDDHGPMYMRWW